MKLGDWALVAALSTAAMMGSSCWSEDGSRISGGGAGGSADAAAGSSGTGAGSGGTSGSGATSGDSGVDLCGGNPCADNTGENEFVEADAPADSSSIFAQGTLQAPGSAAPKEPAIIYPSHETMFPINVSRIRHEWSAGSGTLFKLVFEGPNTTVSVYTTATFWEPTELEWDWIAESNRGSSVTFTVYGIDAANPTDVWTSQSITLLFSRSEVEGAIYYWSTGSEGIMKALVSSPVPIKFYTDPTATDSGTCVACHTFSRDGKRLAVGYGGEKLREVDVPDRNLIIPTSGDRASAWTTFSPDGKLLLVAANGVLTLIDSDTGETVGPNAGKVTLPASTFGTHPDWNATGDKVAFTLALKGGNKTTEVGSIAILPWDATTQTFGAAEVLVPSAGAPDNNYFPAWSPDGKWIAYVNAQAQSKDAVTAVLKLVAATGGTPITLTRVNERVNNVDGITGIGNSMPRWAPSTRPDIFWIAFSSLRAYATVRPQDAKIDQIWIAAIDPTLSDPAYSAFWAPFQDVEEGNHRAFWTHDASDTQCYCQDFCGDGLDNDCNGVADDNCGTCLAEEICADGKDNDCDCAIDECVGENCADGIDNDGDGLIDADDPSCVVK